MLQSISLPGESRGRVRFAVGLAVSALCLWLALRDVPLAAVADSLRPARPFWIALALLSVVLTNLAKAARWRLLFYPRGTHLPVLSLFAILLAGQAVTLAVPVRGGELVRAYLVGERYRDSKVQALATIAVEKLLDVVLLALFLVILVPLLAAEGGKTAATAGVRLLAARQPVLLAGALVLLCALAGLLLLRGRLLNLARSLLKRLPGPIGERGLGLLDAALRGTEALQYPGVVAGISGWSLLAWCLAGVTNYLALLALGLPGNWLVSFTLLTVLQAGVSVPSSPGKLGIFQVLCQVTLAWFGVQAATGFAYGVLLYLIAPLFIMLSGGLLLTWQSWQIRRLAGQAGPRETRQPEALL